MANDKRDTEVTDDATEEQTEEYHTREPATVTLDRVHATPRRIRQN